MSEHVRISDEKNARWDQIERQIMTNHHRLLEERDRVVRKLRRPDRCPHCGEIIDAREQSKQRT